MRSYLVVANQTLGGHELRDELRKRATAGESTFYVLVPNTKAAHYHTVPAAGGFIPMPTIATDYGPQTDEEATAEAGQRLSETLAYLKELGVPAEGRLGSAHPVEAIGEVVADHRFDEIVIATLPKRFSRWLGSDVPKQVERRYGIPVTTVVH
jgi:hypothetical protein